MAYKILHIVNNLNKGGLETMVMNYYRNIDQNKFEFYFLVQKRGGAYENEILRNGNQIFSIPKLSYSPLKMKKHLNALDQFFKDHHFDIVHVHSDSFGYFPLKAAKKIGIKYLILHCHSTNLEGGILKKKIGAFLNKKVPKITQNLLHVVKMRGNGLLEIILFKLSPMLLIVKNLHLISIKD